MENQNILQAMFWEATVGILAVDINGKITNINPFAEEMFGYDKGELVGKQLEILLPESFRSTHTKHRQNYHKNPEPRLMGAQLELFGIQKNGEKIPVEISLSYVKMNGNQLALAYINDVSVLKKAELSLQNLNAKLEEKVKKRTDELRKKEEKLRKALIKEQELGELKSRFVSMASHEFRTPLSSILSSASLIGMYAESDQQEKRMKHVERINSSVENLTTILNDFLSLEKLESGKISCQASEVDFVVFAESVLEEIKTSAKENQQIIHTHLGSPTAIIDEHLVKNILLNLLSNAVKYSTNGENVDLISEIKNASLIVKVKDRGIGIPKVDHDHMFTRFFRATNVTAIQGTGLGLTIVKRYLDLMNGTIDFESKENEGTTFVIEIPQ